MLLSTKSTILENWPGPKTVEPPRKPVYHFAMKQEGVNLDFYFEKFFDDNKVALYYFDDFDELVTICQRFSIDAIVIAGKSDFTEELKLVQAIKQNVFLFIIPVILYNPEPDVSTVVAAYENGAEEFIYGEWIDRLVKVRIRRVVERSRRDMAINPSTHLPGTNIIEHEISREIDMQGEFAICYADLDNFKAYNDYYGYVYGDKIVRLTAKIIRDVVFDLCREGFVGHIAGDDFIFIIPPHMVDDICSAVIKVFDTLIPYRYRKEDRERGHITTTNRRGNIEEFPLLSISIAVIINSNGKFEHIGELSKMLADLKKATKMKAGSNYMVERRTKY